jgi:hypothetical protein
VARALRGALLPMHMEPFQYHQEGTGYRVPGSRYQGPTDQGLDRDPSGCRSHGKCSSAAAATESGVPQSLGPVVPSPPDHNATMAAAARRPASNGGRRA